MRSGPYSHIFAVRPATRCNLACSYCYRSDDLEQRNPRRSFDVGAMVWHANERPGSLFNFCGYGETMLHPQFAEMVIALSRVAAVNWVTNGTLFGGPAFAAILADARHEHLHDVVISIHFGELGDGIEAYAAGVGAAVRALAARGVTVHLTAIVTDDNIDAIIAERHCFDDPITFKTTFPHYVQHGLVRYQGYTPRTRELLEEYDLRPIRDFRDDRMPYLGRACPNGVRIFEVMHDGLIYSCDHEADKTVIGDINRRQPIRALPEPRACRARCPSCSPMLRDGYSLLAPATSRSFGLTAAAG
jgi:MoaA/NifB/PqqE/SkfB family radical SAM enzyme